LAQQGYPISDEFTEVSDLDGQPYRVQYFERAVFEYHPENTGTPHDVLLSQLGTFRFQARYYAGGDQGDADGDGIANVQDSCPAELENINAVFDLDGCPDTTQTLIDFAAEDINAFWQQTFDDSEVEYEPPTEFVGYTEPIETACGDADLNNAFYCGASHGIYYDLNFLDSQLHTFGDLAPVIIIAHEWGHLVQANLGLLGGRYLSVETELQADCFAGAWAQHANEAGMLEEGDLDEAGAALFNAGDEDMPWFDPDAHGPPEQRVRAFADGFQNGVSRCLGGR
jgi:predicted metalloprotease